MKIALTRAEKFNAVVNLTDAGVSVEKIARTIGSDPSFVRRLLEMRTWSAGKRNAWFLGLDVNKFVCV